MKQLLEDRADFRMFVSEPVLPWTTAIIILSMIYKRVNMTAMFLIAAFIFSLNPVYVVLLALFWGLLSLSSKSPKLHLPIKKKALSQVESVVCIYDFTPASISITSFHFSHIDPELFVTYFSCMCVRIRNYQGKFFIIHTYMPLISCTCFQYEYAHVAITGSNRGSSSSEYIHPMFR